MNIPIKQLKKWIAALDSGEYKQGIHRLQSGDNKYCCFGVGCMVFVPKTKRYMYGSWLSGTHADSQTFAPEWLKEINDDFQKKTGTFLTDLNDHGYTFPEIATLLELVYIHKILD
jgi:hypothetical protein